VKWGKHNIHEIHDNCVMEGVNFVTDSRGKKIGVLLDLEKYGDL